MSHSVHVPVLLQEVLEWSQASAGKVFVDGTVGGAGHAAELVKRLAPDGHLIGLDRDSDALDRSMLKLAAVCQPISWNANGSIGPNAKRGFTLARCSYSELPSVVNQLSLPCVDGILLDLGLSSDQLADDARGFSFREEGPLDLRFDTSKGETVQELLLRIREEELANLIFQYGEERFSRRIACAIVIQRRIRPVKTTKELYDLIHRAVPGQHHGRIDSATRTFQALRIAINHELRHLEESLRDLPSLLSENARILVISFHSLEDRLVKNAFRDHPLLCNLTKKPIVASAAELIGNPRARSAKLRVAERKTIESSGLGIDSNGQEP